MRRNVRVTMRLALLCGALSFLSFGLAAAHADDAACHNLANAMIKNSKTAYHSVGAISFDPKDPPEPNAPPNAKPVTTETIFTGTQVFVKLPDGKWQDVHADVADLQGRVQASAEGFNDCKQLADEKIDGKTLMVYTGANKTDTITVDTKIWVAADGGTMSRSETEIGGPTAPDGKIRHQFIKLSYDYADIKAPAASN